MTMPKSCWQLCRLRIDGSESPHVRQQLVIDHLQPSPASLPPKPPSRQNLTTQPKTPMPRAKRKSIVPANYSLAKAATHGAAVTFTRRKWAGVVPMRKLSRTFNVVVSLVSTVVVLAVNESGSAGSSEPALCTS